MRSLSFTAAACGCLEIAHVLDYLIPELRSLAISFGCDDSVLLLQVIRGGSHIVVHKCFVMVLERGVLCFFDLIFQLLMIRSIRFDSDSYLRD